MIEWLWPWAFAALPLPWLVWRFARPVAQRDAALRVPSLASFAARADERKGFRLSTGLALGALAWLSLVVAAARPQLSGPPESLPTTGRDLMLAVDISGSMNTEDMQLDGHPASRLAVVKSVVRDFIAERRGDRVGLVLFGTNAYLQAPLTFDLTTVGQLLDETPVGIAGGKTAIGDAIGLAVKRLRDRPAESRVLILLTDGANNSGEVTPIKAAELSAAEGIRIHTIGVGAEAMRVPGFFGDRVVNPSADLDEPTLTEIAKKTGGRYFRARDTAELESIYKLLDRLEPAAQDPRTFRPIRVLYYWPLGLSWLCVALLASMRAWRPRAAA